MAKAKIAVGDRYQSKSGRGFDVTAVNGDEVTVEVERTIPKDGRSSVETRTRILTAVTWPFFILGYTKQKAKKPPS